MEYMESTNPTELELIDLAIKRGFENVLLIETDVYPLLPLEPVFQTIENKPAYIMPFSSTPNFSNDAAILGIHNDQVDTLQHSLQNQQPESDFYREQRKYWNHYHYSKDFKSLLQFFFQRNEEESIPNLVKLIHFLNADQLEQDRLQYEQQPFYKKWFDKLKGQAWSLERYKRKF
jgi:hypothetical protein